MGSKIWNGAFWGMEIFSLLCVPAFYRIAIVGGTLTVLLFEASQKVGEGAKATFIADLGDGKIGGEQ